MMTKIGRNDPCPCGSGKKYKKCCLLKFEQEKRQNKNIVPERRKDLTGQHASRLSGLETVTTSTRNTFWSEKDVELLDTTQIIEKLNLFGVSIQEKDFIDAANQIDSAGGIVETWRETFVLKASGLDDDFFWLAAKILWKRMVPDKICSEQIVDMIEHDSGYDESLTIWDIIKERYGSRTKSIEEADEMFGDFISLSSWSGDLALNLLQAAEKAPSLYKRLQEYCEDFLTCFPESDEETLAWMLVQLAQSFYGQGMETKGNALFQQAIEEFPDDAWNYILWGDMYWFRRLHDAIPCDLEKAKSTYALALSRNLKEGRTDVEDRMMDLEAMMANAQR